MDDLVTSKVRLRVRAEPALALVPCQSALLLPGNVRLWPCELPQLAG